MIIMGRSLSLFSWKIGHYWGSIVIVIGDFFQFLGPHFFNITIFSVSGFKNACSHWGDLLRSVPFIMCGHSNIEFFQASAASILTRNPLRTCLMMILRHSGRAPKPFVHPFHGMSYHDMSRHDTQKLRLLF